MCKRKPAASDGQGSCRTSGEFVAFFAETDWHRELLHKRNPANRSIATTGDFRLLNGSDVCMDLPCSDLSVRSVLISVDVAPNASLLSFELGCFVCSWLRSDSAWECERNALLPMAEPSTDERTRKGGASARSSLHPCKSGDPSFR